MNYRIFFLLCAGIITCTMSHVYADCITTIKDTQLEAKKMFTFLRQHTCYRIQQLQKIEPLLEITETDEKVIINCNADMQGIDQEQLEQFIRPDYVQEINEQGEPIEYIRLRVFSNAGLFFMYIESEKVTTNFFHMTKNSSKKFGDTTFSADMQEALKRSLSVACKPGSEHDYVIAPINMHKDQVKVEFKAEHGVKIILEKQYKKLVEPIKIDIST